MNYLKSDLFLACLSLFSTSFILASILSLSPFSTREAYAQDRDVRIPATYSFSIRDVPLSEALDALIGETDINLFYESDMVVDQRVFCSIVNSLVEEVLRCMLQGTELDFYQLSSGTYVLIDHPRADAKFGALAGLILDGQTGEPLPDASVMLAYAGTGTATNHDGRFALSQLKPGLHPVIVTHVAYEDLHDSLYVGPGIEMSVRYDMTPRTFVTMPIVIDGLQERIPSERLATRKVAAEELILNPSHTPSTHEALNTIVGVQGGDAFADVHVQGGDSGEHLYALDGIPVFVPIRNGGFFGSFSPFALSKITVHKAGFDASEGSYLAGVIDIEHEMASDPETLLDIQIDPLSANGRLQGSIHQFDNLQVSWMLTGRLGLWDYVQPGPIEQQLREWSRPNTFIYDSLVPGAASDTITVQADTPIEIRFSDIHAATRIRLGPLRSFYLSMYQGHNTFGREGGAKVLESIESSKEDYRWSNQMRQARYEWVRGHRTFFHIGAWSSDYQLIHPADRFPFSPGDTAEEEEEGHEDEELEVEDFNEISEVGFKIGFDSALGARHSVSGSLEPIFTKTKFSLSVDPTGETDPITHQRIRPSRARIQSFFQDDIALSNRTQLKVGSRFTYIPVQQRLYAEPRVSVRHDIPDGPGGAWALYGATGLYRQFIFQFDVSDYNQSTLLPGFRFWIPLGENERASSAYHAAVGILHIPTNHWQFRIEGYYKHQPLLPVLDYINKDGIREADGYAFGGGFSATYEIPMIRLQTQYEYGVARRRIAGRFGDDFIPVPWSAPHQVKANIDIRLLPGLLAVLHWEGIFDRTWAYRQAYYDYLEPLDSQAPPGTAKSAFSFPNQHVLKAFSQMDASLSYERAMGRIHIQARVSIINMLNRKNVFDWLLEEEDSFRDHRDRFTTPLYSTGSIRIRY